MSFHGFSGDGVFIGGGAPASLKIRIRDAIRAATDGRYRVTLATADDANNGESPNNFVN